MVMCYGLKAHYAIAMDLDHLQRSDEAPLSRPNEVGTLPLAVLRNASIFRARRSTALKSGIKSLPDSKKMVHAKSKMIESAP